MESVTIEDLTGSADCVVFADAYERLSDIITADNILFLIGRLDKRRDRPQIIVERAIPVDRAIAELTGLVRIRLSENSDGNYLDELGKIFTRFRGHCPVELELTPATKPDVRVRIRPSDEWFVFPDKHLYENLCDFIKEENVTLVPRRNGLSSGNGRVRRNE